MLHVGAIQKRKNVHRLIEAFSTIAGTLETGSGGISGLRSRRDSSEGDRASTELQDI